jgi:uncharacterized protein DUF2637
MNTSTTIRHLKRLRWGVLATVVAGIATSVAMNILDAPDNTIARAIAAFPPLALFAGIELISRIPSSNRWLSVGRILGTLAVAGVAGSISYSSMVGTVEAYGLDGWRAVIFPISVDGLMLVATLSLVEVVRKIRQLESVQPAPAPVVRAVPQPPAAVIPVSPAVWLPPKAPHRQGGQLRVLTPAP